MSWMKRGQAGTGAGAQPYAAPQAQPFGNQQNMYTNYPSGTGAAPPQPQQSQQYWQTPPQPPQQQPPQQYNRAQQYGQPYTQEYPPNANQYQPHAQTQYNQNYSNQYANPPQNYQQNFYQNQPQNYTPNTAQTSTGKVDGWEDNWDWGWEENAKKAQSMQNMAQQLPVQQQVNNANVIEESFASTDSWNWAMDEKKESNIPAAGPPKQENNEPATLQTNPVGNNLAPELALNNINNQQTEEVKTLSDRDVIKERLPNLALGKRFHLENLTPQWSIESQMSQESSDGPHTLSEGTYRSENQSRNSGESPGPNTDNVNFNYAQPGFDETYTQTSEWSKNSDEPTVADSINNISRRESHEELSNSLQEMSIANEHHPAHGIQAHSIEESRSFQENLATQPLPTISPANFPPPVSGSMSVPSMSMPPPPPPQLAEVLPQLPPQASLPSLPRPPSSSSTSSLPGHAAPAQTNSPQPLPTSSPVMLPPSLPPPSNSQNPFQRAGPFSHKSTTKPSSVPTQPFQAQMTSSNLTSPAVVNKVSQSRGPVGFEANLETTPDNSERPDQPQVLFRPMPGPQSIPDNMEVAPQNDRNEYLQTAHLSSGNYGENTDFSRNLPPPGLRRMVVGQQESEYQNLNISGDEPPPGLSRMVPGQQTEADNAYNQPSDSYMDRHIDGQPMENAGSARPFRQADGQQNLDNYSQPITTRANDRRPVGPVGFDRMVPGEPSNDEYSQYQGSNYANNEQRVVTGLDHDFPNHTEANPSDVRERNMDGSDYTEPPRNVIGAREAVSEVTQDFAAPDETQREVTMEGENLQDLSVISSADLTYSREQLDGADQVTDGGTDRNDASDSLDRPVTSSRKQSLNRVHSSGDDSERDKAFKASPRRDRHKTSRDRDRDRNRDRDKEGRYSRGDRNDRKYERDDRRRDDKRTDKDRRDRNRGREADVSPDARKQRRSTRSRKYDDEDTDYNSDRERERRRYREGSYASKPPRGEDEAGRRERRRDRDRDRPRDSERRDRDRDRDRYERHYADYRDIDPSRKYGNLHREREDERRRGDTFSSASRPESREAGGTDEDAADARRSRRSRHHRADRDPYYDGYGGGAYQDPYALQRQQYSYYEQLRVTDPAAYMQLYKQLMAPHASPHAASLASPHAAPHAAPLAPHSRLYVAGEGYPGLGYEERGSVHSGRSSVGGLKGNDTELTTDASLGLQLDASTVRSERMTPFRFSTAHIKGSIGCRDIVLVEPAYPVDGKPATVQLLSLAAARATDPAVRDLLHSPGPLLKGVTHKKSVIEYCMVRVRNASREGARDVIGYVLVWELLALMLRQNGVVVGTDIAELLMKNSREYEHKCPGKGGRSDSRRESSLSGSLQEDTRNSCSPLSAAQQNDLSLSETMGAEALGSPCVEEKEAIDKFREYLLYGNRQEALEWAMSNNLWGHAMQLAAGGDRRARAAVSARFLSAIPRTDPLHTLYATLAGSAPPAATCVSEETWGEWRSHAAMLLANAPSHSDRDPAPLAALTTLGDSLASRGLIYCAQFCYVTSGVGFARHPLAPLPPPSPDPPAQRHAPPPRLALLLGSPRATTLQQLAPPRAVLATEIYEYARSLNADYVIDELQVFKLMSACRLVDAGQYERALAYVELAARAVTRDPARHSQGLVRALADLADRLKYHDPALGAAGGAEEGAESAEGSPRHHQWLDDVKNLAHTMQVESASRHATPHHQHSVPSQNHAWGEQAQTYQQTPNQTYLEPEAAAQPDYSQYYQPSPPEPEYSPHQPEYSPQQPEYSPQQPEYPPQQPEYSSQQSQPAEPASEPGPPQYHYEDWSRTEETHSQSYGDPYWQGDSNYTYGEAPRGLRFRPSRAAPSVPPAPPATDACEPPELRPSLRRRVHPAPRPRPGPAFASPSPPRPLSDLDIQLAHSPRRAPAPAAPAAAAPRYGAGRGPRCGRFISSTVDTWSRRAPPDRAYKPLVFGGTYPIEVPTSPEAPPAPLEAVEALLAPLEAAEAPPAPLEAADAEAHKRELRRTIERSLDKFEAILARRGALPPRPAPRTFDIDAPLPLAPAAAPAAAPPRRKDAIYFVSGAETFDIDAPC